MDGELALQLLGSYQALLVHQRLDDGRRPTSMQRCELSSMLRLQTHLAHSVRLPIKDTHKCRNRCTGSGVPRSH